MEIRVYDGQCGDAVFTVEQLAAMAPDRLAARERVDGAEGRAFDWCAWHEAWRSRQNAAGRPMPTHLQVEAADSFQATVPWPELARAMVVYAADNGEPLKKSYPLRLYVPDGSSACLNVKSVVSFRLLYDDQGGEASYGFKSKFSPEELLKRPGPSGL